MSLRSAHCACSSRRSARVTGTPSTTTAIGTRAATASFAISSEDHVAATSSGVVHEARAEKGRVRAWARASASVSCRGYALEAKRYWDFKQLRDCPVRNRSVSLLLDRRV